MAAELPFVTVVVLNYNGLAHLEPCFRSLAALDYPQRRVELLLVDNGSRDGSLAYMEKHFPAVRLIRNERNLGFAAGNNIGARAAQGELVAFLNNDMRVAPNWLRELVAPFERGEDVAAVGGKILSWDGKRIDFAAAAMNIFGYGYQLGAGQRAADDSSEVRPMLFVCGGNMAVRREVYLDAGGLDDDYFAYYEDADLGWRLWVLGYRVLFTPTAVVYHRHHGTGRHLADEKRRLLYERNALYTIIKNYEDETLQRVLPSALLLLLERCYLLSGIEGRDFRLTGEAGPPALQGQTGQYTATYYARRAWQTIRQEGLGGLWAKVRAELRWRSASPLGRGRARRRGERIAVPPQALSGLVAADDLIRHLPRLWEKRQAIQARRRRIDAEILPLFETPLELSLFDPAYQAAQNLLVELWTQIPQGGTRDDAAP